ncbi:MAG: AMP-binding protein [Bacillaceae bacterium]|nr:AMP-binding protein [Bacillaceae bacterium]
MKVFKLIYVLYKIKLLSLLGLYRFIWSFFTCGMNLMTLLDFAEKKYANKTVLVDDKETLTYSQLLAQSYQLAIHLKENYQIQSGQKVGFLCKNHASLVKAIFAVSRLGADLYLLNAELKTSQFNQFVERHDFDFLIYDLEFMDVVHHSDYSNVKLLSYHDQLVAIDNIVHSAKTSKVVLPRNSSSKLVLQTSGTTGMSKEAAHKPSIFNYLNPFAAFLQRLKILNYNTAYIASPLFHGYGIAVLLLFIPLGKKVVISHTFEALTACRLIRDHQAEVVTLVPLMLQKMLQHNVDDLRSLVCVASGGAKLSTKLVDETQRFLGDVLYNLYGTSESGLNFIATPEDLRYSPATIGKRINGMAVRVLDEQMEERKSGQVGQLCIKNDWSIRNKNNTWIQTGDLAYKDENNYYFLCGRSDDMVVSGGENVYPIEVEQAVIQHSFIEDVAVVGVPDEQFGQRLTAFVLLTEDADLTEKDLLEWMRLRLPRFQIPKSITFVHDMPYTPQGKLDKKQLRRRIENEEK